MRESLNKNGWACLVFAAIMLLAQTALGPALEAVGQTDRSSPGAGIGIVVGGLMILGAGILALGAAGTAAAKIANSYYGRLPAKVQPYGPLGFLFFPLPFATFWWFFIQRS